MVIFIDNHECLYQVRCLVGMFFSGEKIEILEQGFAEVDGNYIYTGKRYNLENLDIIELKVEVKINDRVIVKTGSIEQSKFNADLQNLKNEIDLRFGILIYQILSDITGIYPAWGILTGIRPVKRVSEMLNKNIPEDKIRQTFLDNFLVSPKKVDLMLKTAYQEQIAYNKLKYKDYSLYISIPFCPSRCLYCSFVSHSIEKTQKLIEPYVERLCEEIVYTAKVAKDNKLTLSTVYIGGGTPTAISAEMLIKIFDTVKQNFDLSNILEYTVEAGRADTVTKEKLIAIKNSGATRISINPQTMQDSVLDAIGRKHSSNDVISAYNLARECGFDNINMDIIAGLHTDDIDGFKYTIDKIIDLNPENITIHTLSVKRSSDMVYQGKAIYDSHGGLVENMLDYAYDRLDKSSYLPYYLYRQKNMRDNMENVGFSKEDKMCLYNVYIMEEIQTILACGAGAVTKLKHPDQKYIKRIFNYKFPYEYLDSFEEMLKRKEEIYNFYNS